MKGRQIANGTQQDRGRLFSACCHPPRMPARQRTGLTKASHHVGVPGVSTADLKRFVSWELA